MKKFLIGFFILIIAVAAIIAYRSYIGGSGGKTELPPEQSSPESSEPGASSSEEVDDEAAAAKKAVADLLDSLKNWDEDAVDKLMAEMMPDVTLPSTYKKVLRPICESLEYELGNAKAEGGYAEVDVSITSLDARSALNKVISGAVAYVAAKQLMGAAGTPEEHLIDYLADKIDWRNLSTVRTDATVYLVKAGDGTWKVDATNGDNMGFLDAITGGAVEVIKSLQELAAQFS